MVTHASRPDELSDVRRLHLPLHQGRLSFPIGSHTRFHDFATIEELVAFFQRCHPDDPDELRDDMRRWGRVSAYCNLSDDQYAKLDFSWRATLAEPLDLGGVALSQCLVVSNGRLAKNRLYPLLDWLTVWFPD